MKKSSRFLHVMLRVKSLQESVDFYAKYFDLKVLRQEDYTGGRFSLVFLGYEDEESETVIELTHNWDEQVYEKGQAFGHLAFSVKDVVTMCDELRKDNIVITREAGPMKFDPKQYIAFIEDPDAYSIELIQV